MTAVLRMGIKEDMGGAGREESVIAECLIRRSLGIKEHHSKLTNKKRNTKPCNRTQEISKQGNLNAQKKDGVGKQEGMGKKEKHVTFLIS